MPNASAGGLAYVSAGAGGGAAVTIGGNTAGVGALVSSGTLVLAGGNNITLSQNGQSLTISGPNVAGAQTAISGVIVSNTTYTSGTISFSNANGISFGSSAGQAITGSYTVPVVPALSIGVSGGNTSGTSGTFSGQIVFAGGNNVTLSASSGALGAQTITISAFTQTVQTQASGNIAGTATAITGNASLTLNSAGLSLNGSGLAGTNTAITGNASITLNSSGLSFNGSGLCGTGGTTGTTSAGAIQITLNSVGLSLLVPNQTRLFWPDQQLTAVSAPGNATLSIQYLPMYGGVSGSRIDALVAMSAGSAATTATAAIAFSAYAIFYTRNASTLNSIYSGSTQTTYSYASNTAGNTQLTASAVRALSVPVNFHLNPGEYYVGFNFITSASSIGLSTTNLGLTMSMMGGAQLQSAIPYADITANTATSTNQYGGMGIYTAATTGAPISINLNAIAQTGASFSQANYAFVLRNG